jgi:nucleotide-binding universal stress UspA family protein
MNNKVMACIDHSSYAPSVCDYAAWAALQMSAPLEFIHVLDRHPETAKKRDLSGSIGLGSQEALLEELASLDEKVSRIAQESGRVMLETAKQRARADGVSEPDGRQRHGEFVETLAELEKDARLFVLGKRGEAAESAPQHLGSNLERVVRAVHRPILVVPKEYKKPAAFMVAFDGSATTRKGIEMIASSPLFRGLPCHVVMAGTDTGTAGGHMDWAGNTLRDAGFDVHASIIPGEADAVLGTYLQEHAIDVLVMGAYGHSRIRRLLVGSTTTTMIRTAAVPLLLLR